MITTVTEIFNAVLNKPASKNLALTIVAVTLAKTFRINEIGGCLPIATATQKTKQKRLARFIDSAFPTDAVMRCWHTFVLQKVSHAREKYTTILIDETDLIGGFKAIVAAIPFRQRAIPIYWWIYSNEEIGQMQYKSHNTLIKSFAPLFITKRKRFYPMGANRNSSLTGDLRGRNM